MLREIQVTPVIGPKPSANPKSLIERYRGMVESLPDVVADARIGEFIRSTANRLVQSPELMEFFYRRNSLYKKENPIYAPEVDRFEKHVEADIDNLVRNCNTLSLNEKQLLGFFKLSEGKNLLSEETRTDLGNNNPNLDSDIYNRAQSIMKGLFDATMDQRLVQLMENNSNFSPRQMKEIEDRFFNSQIKITDLMYKLATSALSSGDETLLEKFLAILAFESPYLKGDDPKSLFFLYSAISLDDETMAKRNRIDFLGGLLENKFLSPSERKKLATAGESVVKQFNNSFFMKVIESLINNDHEKSSKLLDYVESLKPFGTETEVDDDDPFLTWTKGLEMPEKVIYRADRFMLFYFSSLSDRLLVNGSIQTPIELVITDDDQLRYIATSKHDNFEVAQQVMARLLDERKEGSVSSEFFISSMMHLLRPKIDEERMEKVKKKNKLLKERLKNPSRGLNKDGIIIKIDGDKNPDLYFSEIHYDHSGRKVRVNFSGRWFDISLDHSDLSLKHRDGKTLVLNEKSMLWWENVILAPLEKLVCNGEENDWLVAGTEDLPVEKALEIKRKMIIKRIGHLRREPPKKGYTEEQRNRVLSLPFPLPGIEILDLKVWNEERGLTREKGQFTYVLPVEQEPTGKPIEVTVPAAFDF